MDIIMNLKFQQTPVDSHKKINKRKLDLEIVKVTKVIGSHLTSQLGL